MKHKVILFIALAVFWLLSSGHHSTLMLSLGASSILLVLHITQRMDAVDQDFQPIHFSPKFPGYIIWLFKQLILSNIAVVKCIWSGNDSISPTLTTIKISQKTNLGKVVYANSISITPGTITVDLVGDRIMVHALRKQNIEALKSGDMDSRVRRLEK